MRELLATERDYINDLQKCIEVYLRAYRMSENSAPVSIQCKEKELFGNIEDLFQFHANQFLDALKTYEQNPELVYCCFCTYAEKLKDLYTGFVLFVERSYYTAVCLNFFKFQFHPQFLVPIQNSFPIQGGWKWKC